MAPAKANKLSKKEKIRIAARVRAREAMSKKPLRTKKESLSNEEKIKAKARACVAMMPIESPEHQRAIMLLTSLDESNKARSQALFSASTCNDDDHLNSVQTCLKTAINDFQWEAYQKEEENEEEEEVAAEEDRLGDSLIRKNVSCCWKFALVAVVVFVAVFFNGFYKQALLLASSHYYDL